MMPRRARIARWVMTRRKGADVATTQWWAITVTEPGYLDYIDTASSWRDLVQWADLVTHPERQPGYDLGTWVQHWTPDGAELRWSLVWHCRRCDARTVDPAKHSAWHVEQWSAIVVP